MLSQSAQYALRAALALASGDSDQLSDVKELAGRLSLPRNYLSKILHQLARAGVLASTRGKGGGFRLARGPDRITLLDVVGVFDELGPRRECLLGRVACSDAKPCAAHHRWAQISEQLVGFFRETSLAQLAE
jgi:Rrf2 family protein